MLSRFKNVLKKLTPNERRSKYLGYSIHHHKNDSLMLRVIPPWSTKIMENLKGVAVKRIYEPEETTVILATIENNNEPRVLDIGANIGLMSLNICEFNKKAKVYSFEPGVKQFKFLKLNIGTNMLSDRIWPYNIALSDTEGFANFYSHETEHSSGDGFRETGRAGAAELIKVKTQTLDGWWQTNGSPAITTIKIDTEGSELTILRNGVILISKCRPYILIEIASDNFSTYHHSYSDFIDFFNGRGYTLSNLKTSTIIRTPSDFIGADPNFMASPNEKSLLPVNRIS